MLPVQWESEPLRGGCPATAGAIKKPRLSGNSSAFSPDLGLLTPLLLCDEHVQSTGEQLVRVSLVVQGEPEGRPKRTGLLCCRAGWPQPLADTDGNPWKSYLAKCETEVQDGSKKFPCNADGRNILHLPVSSYL